jgi:hypothetical protein
MVMLRRKALKLKNRKINLKVFLRRKIFIEELFMVLDKINKNFISADIDENIIELTFDNEISKEYLIDLILDSLDNISWIELEII